MKDVFSRLVMSRKQRSAPGSPDLGSPDTSPRQADRNSPRKSSLLDPRNRGRSRSVIAFNSSPRTAASLEYLWLLRPEVRAFVEKACAAVDSAAQKPLAVQAAVKDLVERCLFSARMAEQERVRELAFVSPLWGGPRAVLSYAYNAFVRMAQGDRELLGPTLLQSIVSWVEYECSPSLEPETLRLSELLCGLVAEGDQWMARIVIAVEHAVKTHRAPVLVFPLLAPPETVRLQFVDLVADLDRRELAEEIVQLVWRIFMLIRPVEWTAYMCRHGGASVLRLDLADRATACENILSLVQFTKSLQHWIRGTLALRRDKGKVVQFWLSVAELCLGVNGHHPGLAIFEAVDASLAGPNALVRWPEGFPGSAVAMYTRVKGLCAALPTKTEFYLSAAQASASSTERHPFVPPLARILEALQLCVKTEGATVTCATEEVVGLVELVQYLQQGIRHYGVGAQPLSHDMHDLLQEMPLLPEPLLRRLAEASLRGLSEPDGSSMDFDTSGCSSEHRSSDMSMGSEAGGQLTPPLTARTPSPLGGSPQGTPRLTPRPATPVRLMGSDRADLGLSISYRVHSQKGSSQNLSARGPAHVLLASESGRLRFEDERNDAATEDPDVMRFSVTGGLIKVTWVRGLRELARLLTGMSPIGFLPNVVDDVLFGWRLVFTKPSQLLRLIVDEYPDVPPERSSDHLNPKQIFGLDSVRAVRKRVLYVIKRLVDIERANVASLTSDAELLDIWAAFFRRIKSAATAPSSSELRELSRSRESQRSTPRTSREREGSPGAEQPQQPPQPQQPQQPEAKRDSKEKEAERPTPRGGRTTPREGLRSSLGTSAEKSLLHRGNSASSALGGFVFQSQFMDEFVCATTIEWSLRNGKTRSLLPTVAPPPEVPIPHEKTLVENLTMVEQNAFCGVCVGELLGFPRLGSEEGLLRWVVGRFNKTSSWVCTCIVREEDVVTRATWVLYFVRLAQSALAVGNVSLAFAVLAGLESLAVVRLKKTWEKAAEMDSKKLTMAAFEAMKETFSPESGQLQLRVFHLSNLSRIRVPFVGLWTKDVFLIDRNNATYLARAGKRVQTHMPNPGAANTENNDGGIVPPTVPMAEDDVLNVEKLSMIADAVCRVIFFQGNETASGPRDPIIDPVGTADVASEEELYALSLKREPRDKLKL